MKLLLAAMLVLAFAAAAVPPADNPAVGTWQCAFSTRDGDDMECTLTLKEEGGKLVGAIIGGATEIPLTEVKQNGDELSFKFTGMGDVCTIEVRLSGNKLAGKWNSGGEQGAFKGEKKS